MRPPKGSHELASLRMEFALGGYPPTGTRVHVLPGCPAFVKFGDDVVELAGRLGTVRPQQQRPPIKSLVLVGFKISARRRAMAHIARHDLELIAPPRK